MQHIISPEYNLHREQCQDRCRSQAQLLIRDRGPRENQEHCQHSQGHQQTIHGHAAYFKIWCTGEDSNLRSSKERQIYSLLPLTARPPVQNAEKLGQPEHCRATVCGSTRPSHRNKRRSSKSERANTYAHKLDSPDKILDGVRWKNFFALVPRASAQLPLLPENYSGAGEGI
jgi:hypothetical protein